MDNIHYDEWTDYLTKLLKKRMEGSFEGHSFQIPVKYDRMLTKIYGDYMSLPPVDQQKTRHDLLKFSIKED